MNDEPQIETIGAGSAYNDFEYEGTRETSCLICGKSNAEMRTAHITTPGGLRVLLCAICTARWESYGLVVTTVEEGLEGPGLRAQSGNRTSPSSTAAAHRSQ